MWAKDPSVREWQVRSRLDPYTRRIRAIQPSDSEAMAHLQRYGRYVKPAAQNAARLLAA